MSNVKETYKAFCTVLEMAKDRNYIVPEEYTKVDFNTFNYLYINKKIDIYITKHSKIDKKLYIKFTYEQYKPSLIKECINHINKEFLGNKNDKIILILNEKPNNTILKISKEKQYNMIDIFWIDILQFNITKHNFVPKHELVNDEELQKIMKKYNITNLLQFPIILKTDPVIKYYDFPQGCICKITRPSITVYTHVFYRYIK